MLKVGNKAPDFEAKDQNGTVHKLSDYKGKKIVLFFYPKDMTPGCTKEACNLRDNYEVLKKEGYILLGVSADSEERHQKFIDKHNLPFTLLSDPDLKLIKKYEVWGLKKFMGKEYEGILRTTYVINEDAKVEKVIEKVKTAAHAEQILDQ